MPIARECMPETGATTGAEGSCVAEELAGGKSTTLDCSSFDGDNGDTGAGDGFLPNHVIKLAQSKPFEHTNALYFCSMRWLFFYLGLLKQCLKSENAGHAVEVSGQDSLVWMNQWMLMRRGLHRMLFALLHDTSSQCLFCMKQHGCLHLLP